MAKRSFVCKVQLMTVGVRSGSQYTFIASFTVPMLNHKKVYEYLVYTFYMKIPKDRVQM